MATIQFSTDHLPERERIPFWHETICQGGLNVTPTWESGGEGFQGRVEMHMAGRFMLADLHTTHGSVEKTPSDLARGASDSALLYLAVQAGQTYAVGSHVMELGPGDICIVPMDRRFRGSAGAIAFRSVLIPHAVLGPMLAGRELERTQHLAAATPLGSLLRASLQAAATQVPHLTAEMGDAVLANLSGLVALAVGSSDEGAAAGRDALRQARLTLVKRHIHQHLAEPLLDPAAVAAALRVSVRQLHLLFQPTGESFAQYLLGRRLDACRATLTSHAAVGRSVADIAFGWGFNSLSVFYRAFSARFATTPQAMRAQAALTIATIQARPASPG